jgi:hypothetical protein
MFSNNVITMNLAFTCTEYRSCELHLQTTILQKLPFMKNDNFVHNIMATCTVPTVQYLLFYTYTTVKYVRYVLRTFVNQFGQNTLKKINCTGLRWLCSNLQQAN